MKEKNKIQFFRVFFMLMLFGLWIWFVLSEPPSATLAIISFMTAWIVWINDIFIKRTDWSSKE